MYQPTEICMHKEQDVASKLLVFEVDTLDLGDSFLDRVVRFLCWQCLDGLLNKLFGEYMLPARFSVPC